MMLLYRETHAVSAEHVPAHRGKKAEDWGTFLKIKQWRGNRRYSGPAYAGIKADGQNMYRYISIRDSCHLEFAHTSPSHVSG